ncbi:MAG: S46 family peptidase, partial [Thermoguttaceae bacterium]|nr:S46 family peptidase [Thermoguttaceae bacterium]
FLKWSDNGASEGDLVFVSGHPARTNRFNTVADLQYQRDVYYPHMMNKYRRREVAYQVFGSENDENGRRIATSLFRIQNSRKNRGGILNGLQTVALMQKKIDAENELRKLAAEKGLVDAANDPWAQVEAIMAGWRGRYLAYDLLEANEAFTSATVAKARAIVRYVSEVAKPEAERLPAYRGDSLEGTRNGLLGGFGGDADIETMMLTDGLSMLYEYSKAVDGGRALDAVVIPQADFDGIFDGLSPKSRATQIVQKSQLKDRKFRESLVDMSWEDLQKSDDPAIRLALAVEPTARMLRDYNEAEVAGPSRAAYAKIAKIRFAVYGTEVYPDATFTLRLSYGKVAGYTEDDGTQVPFETKVSGAYEHAREHNFADPFDLSQSWLDAEAAGKAPMDAPLNLVTTNDIIGGNSGSPAVNSKGEVVGLIFDGNIESLVLNFTYDDEVSRAVLVHSTGIREVVRSVYDLPQVADELGK